jgi:hypothetical protein
MGVEMKAKACHPERQRRMTLGRMGIQVPISPSSYLRVFPSSDLAMTTL